MFTGRAMTAEEGERWGFYNQLVSAEELLLEATRVARSLATGPTFAHSMTKNMLNQEWNMSLEQALEAEAQAQAICMQTEDFRRAFEAFAAKRKPEFVGK
jgi:enoyl-CoA hydratase/carnithine racemase